MSQHNQYPPLSYVLLTELSPEPFIAQVSVDGQTLIMSNRFNLSQLLVVEDIIEEALGSRTDWLKKYPTTYTALATLITKVEGGDQEVENQILSERKNDIKAVDSLLQIRALHFLANQYNPELTASEEAKEPLSNQLLESAVLYALQNDDLICDLHSHFSTLYHKVKVEEAENFTFQL